MLKPTIVLCEIPLEAPAPGSSALIVNLPETFKMAFLSNCVVTDNKKNTLNRVFQYLFETYKYHIHD